MNTFLCKLDFLLKLSATYLQNSKEMRNKNFRPNTNGYRNTNNFGVSTDSGKHVLILNCGHALKIIVPLTCHLVSKYAAGS